MAESKRQSGEEALDAQVAQLSRELESDAAGDPPKARTPTANAPGGLSTVGADEHQDTDGGIAELDDALFAAAPTLEASEIAEALGHAVPEAAAPGAPAGPIETKAPPSLAADSVLSGPEMVAPAGPEAIDALMDQVSEDLEQVANEVESARLDAGSFGLVESPTPAAQPQETEQSSTVLGAVEQPGQASPAPEVPTSVPVATAMPDPAVGADSSIIAAPPGAEAAALETKVPSTDAALSDAAPKSGEGQSPAAVLDAPALPSTAGTVPETSAAKDGSPTSVVEQATADVPASVDAGPAPTAPATATPAIEALDTRLAETAAEVLAEAQRREAELAAHPPVPEAVIADSAKADPASATTVTPQDEAAPAAGARASTAEAEEASFAAPEQVASASAPPAAKVASAAPAEQAASADSGNSAESVAAARPSSPSTAQGGASVSGAPGKASPSSEKSVQGGGPGGKTASKSESPKEAAPEKPKVSLGQRLKPVAAAALSPLIKLTDKLPTKTRQTVGFVAIVTLLNACALWGFLMLRSPDASGGGEVKGAVPLLKPGDPAPLPEEEGAPGLHGESSAGSHGKPDAGAKADDGHGAKKDDGHGAPGKGTSAKKPSKSTKSAKTTKKGKDTKTASADAHGGGH